MSREIRFWSKANKEGGGDSGCWEWTAYKSRNGYGQFRSGTGALYAHRVAWELTYGAIPEGKDIDHKCHNRACVRPTHLRTADRSSNLQNRSGANVNSSSGVRGVYWDKRRSKWYARAKLKGKVYNLGYYATRDGAEAAATSWRQENMPYSLMDRKETA